MNDLRFFKNLIICMLVNVNVFYLKKIKIKKYVCIEKVEMKYMRGELN